MLSQDLHQMRVEIISLLDRLASCLPGSKEQKVFLINNLDQILSIIQERRVPINEDLQKFEDLLMQQREFFAEEELKYSFPRLIHFVLQTEQLIANCTSGYLNCLNNFQINAIKIILTIF